MDTPIDNKVVCQHVEDNRISNSLRREEEKFAEKIKGDKICCSMCEDEGFFEDNNEENFFDVSDTHCGYLRKYKMWKSNARRIKK